MTTLPGFSIGSQGQPQTLVAVVPGPKPNPFVYDNIIATAPFPNQINAKNLIVGGGFYIDLADENDTIRVKPADGAFFPPTGDTEGPNTLDMYGGEISMDGGNDLIRVINTLPQEGYSPAFYMGASSYFYTPALSPTLAGGEGGENGGRPIVFPFIEKDPEADFIFPALGGNSVYMGSGNDTIRIAAKYDGLYMDGEFTGNGNLVLFGEGEDLLQISAGRTGLVQVGSSNWIFMGSDNDTIGITMSGSSYKANSFDSSGNLISETSGIYISGADNGISTQAGEDLIAIDGKADNGIVIYSGSISTGQDSDKISVDNDGGYGIYMGYGGFIGLGLGSDTLVVSSKDTALYMSYGSILKMGSGHDLVTLTTNTPETTSTVEVYTGSQILLGAGNDTFTVSNGSVGGTGIYMQYGAKFDAGEGSDSISVFVADGTYGIYVSSGSAIYLGSGDDTLRVDSNDYGIYLSEGALLDLDEGNNLVDVFNKDGDPDYAIYSYESSITAGVGNDTIKVDSGGEGIYLSASNVKMGAGNNLIDITAQDQALYLYDSNLNYGDGDDGPGDDTLKIVSTSDTGLEAEYSSLSFGGGANLIDIKAAEGGIELKNGSNIVSGDLGDTIKVRSTDNDFVGIYLDSGSSINLHDGNNLIDVVANGDTAIELYYYSAIRTGSENDTILAIGSETSDSTRRSNSQDVGIEIDEYSGIYTGDGDDFILADASVGLEVTEQSGIDTGFGFDTILANGNGFEGIYLRDGSINTGNNGDYIKATSVKDYALVTENFASINTGRGFDVVDLTAGGWETNGGGSINTGAGNDTVLLGDWDVTGNWLEVEGMDTAAQSAGFTIPEVSPGAAYVNFGRGDEDMLRLSEGIYNIFQLPNIFNGLYGILDQEGDILAVTNLEFLGGVGSSGQTTGATLAFPIASTSYTFYVNTDGDAIQGVPV